MLAECKGTTRKILSLLPAKQLLMINPWGEYKRRSPANAAVIGSACLKLAFILLSAAFAFYALKCKPFQSMSMTAAPLAELAVKEADPLNRHQKADEGILRGAAPVAPLAVIQKADSRLSQSGKSKISREKQLAANKHRQI